MERTTAVANRPVWVDLGSSNPEAARSFYANLFGWQVEVNPDPKYGGYAIAELDGKDVAGIGPKMSGERPDAWALYIGTPDAEALGRTVQEAGGSVVMPAFDVGDQGRIAVFQDPTGAFISAWQATQMRGFETDVPGAFGWAELSARGVDQAVPFYERVFGWATRRSDMGEGQPPYIEFQLDGESIAGGWEMSPNVPVGTPSYWMVYFDVDDVDAAFRRALEGGGREMVAPQDFPGGRFAVVADPQGAMFGLLRTAR
ncbi:MAG TPA: VOC family protein [Candidatus Limnocylindrales bacterium]|nr:VOC family protein [Candidatus Limnocylindrales bacterium]